MTGDVYASSYGVTIPSGTSVPGCEETNGCWLPAKISVSVGDSVIWSNADIAAHTVTSGTSAGGPDGIFDSSLFLAGSTFEVRFDSPGEYPYFCVVHPWMQGEVVVKGTTVTPTPTPTIKVATDRTNYQTGDMIRISGRVSEVLLGVPVSIIVKSSNGNIIARDLAHVDNQRHFEALQSTDTSPWGATGIYTIIAQYGPQARTAQTSIFFTVITPIPTPPTPSTPTTPEPSAVSTTFVTVARGSSVPGCETTYSCYSPYAIKVDRGTTVTWTNVDAAVHTVTSGDPTNGPDGIFDSSMIVGGDTFQARFYSPGEYPYFCMIHPWQTGTVHVTGSVVQPATPARSSTLSPTSQKTGSKYVEGFWVDFQIRGGNVLNITPDVDANSLIIEILSSGNGELTITLPRGLIDAKIGNADESFFVLVDGGETRYDESSNSRERTLKISFYDVTDEIEIIGTDLGDITSQPRLTPKPTPSTPTTPEPSAVSTNFVTVARGSSVPGCEETYSCYSPYAIKVDRGTTVTWTNVDAADHTVTSGSAVDGPDGNFDSSMLSPSREFTHTFSSSGTFDYFCMVHPWQTGTVYVTGSVVQPTTPTPAPSPRLSLSVFSDSVSYFLGSVVEIDVNLSGGGSGNNVAISVTDSNRDSVVSRAVTTDSRGSGDISFKLSDTAITGTYNVVATTSVGGQTYKDSTTFSVKSSGGGVSIITLQPTDQQGNPVSSFSKGKLGFVKLIVSAESNTGSLITVNLFDSELTSLGIGSFKTTLSPGQSEMVLSFFIPNDSVSGSADIYANAFSDWPSLGGTPLTGESSARVSIR